MSSHRGVGVVAAVVLTTTLFGQDPPPPQDPPEGLDWFHHGKICPLTLVFLRGDDPPARGRRAVIKIEPNNPNFDSTHCCTTAGSKVAHKHFTENKDYGDKFGTHGRITEAEGKAYWDWYYSCFDPKPEGGDKPTGTTNCVSHAYDEYKSEDTKAKYWVDPVDAGPYRDELHEIFPKGEKGDNSDKDTIAEDRCADGAQHVWIVKTSPGCAATKIEWKNNSSGIYTWPPQNPTNDAPKGRDGDGNAVRFEDYGIYNKTDR